MKIRKYISIILSMLILVNALSINLTAQASEHPQIFKRYIRDSIQFIENEINLYGDINKNGYHFISDSYDEITYGIVFVNDHLEFVMNSFRSDDSTTLTMYVDDPFDSACVIDTTTILLQKAGFRAIAVVDAPTFTEDEDVEIIDVTTAGYNFSTSQIQDLCNSYLRLSMACWNILLYQEFDMTMANVGFYNQCPGHKFFEYGTPTCKSQEMVCHYCGEIYYDTTIRGKHNYKKTKVVKPTYAAKGYTLYTCSTCKATKKSDYKNALTVAKPVISKVTSPKSKQIKVTWGKKSYTGYQVQIATDSKFTKNKKSATIKKASTVSTTFTKLKGKKKYYVRVRAYKTYNGKNYYSAWSSVKTVTTKK